MAEANRSDETELPGVIRQLNATFASMGIVDFCEIQKSKGFVSLLQNGILKKSSISFLSELWTTESRSSMVLFYRSRKDSCMLNATLSCSPQSISPTDEGSISDCFFQPSAL